MLKLISRLTGHETPQEDVRADIRSAIASDFDAVYYLATYPDVAEVGCDPLDHYIKYGAREGRDPSPRFSTSHYLGQNPDVRESGMNPLHHYVVHGRAEGREPRRPEVEEALLDAWIEDLDETAEAISGLFDAEFYFRRYPDLDPATVDPLQHYLTRGAAEGRDPAPWFSTRYYLETHADVCTAGINPLLHYARAGRAENRLTRPPGGFRAEALRKMQPLDAQVRRWTRNTDGLRLLGAEDLARALWRKGDIAPWMILSISHDDYLENTGGVQLAIQTEAAAFGDERIDYINIHPAQPLPILAPEDRGDELLLVLRRNGHKIGAASVANIALVFDRLAEKGLRFDLIVHALQGHAPEAIARIAEAARVKRSFFWVHDSFSICPGFTLMRNDVRYCGAPAADSPGCGICVYGTERLGHLPRVRAMFETLRPVAIAPSMSAAKHWVRHANLPVSRVVTHSHCTLARPMDAGTAPVPAEDPLRIAFLGLPRLYKGWPAFEEIVNRTGVDAGIEFHHFGTSDPGDPRIRHTEVRVTRDDREAMTRAIYDHRIDIAFLWSLCPETFSFAAFEALAAGALILTHADSGNIAALVGEEDAGWVLPDEDAATALIASGGWRERVARRRAEAGPPRVVVYSDLTVDLLLREQAR